MILSIGPLVDRGAVTGSRRCDGCHQYRFELRECRIHDRFSRDLCGPCIDKLRRMPRLPAVKPEAAWERALGQLRRPYRASTGQGVSTEGVR